MLIGYKNFNRKGNCRAHIFDSDWAVPLEPLQQLGGMIVKSFHPSHWLGSALHATYSVNDLLVHWCTIYRFAQKFQDCKNSGHGVNFRTPFRISGQFPGCGCCAK